MKRWLKQCGAWCLRLGFLVLVLVGAAPWLFHGRSRSQLEVRQSVMAAVRTAAPRRESSLRVLSLNLAHGRGDGKHQALLSRATIEENLGAAAALLRREVPDVVALQEADGPSLWSGHFDHVEHLARAAGFPWYVRTDHVAGPLLHYGTALLSQREPFDAVSQTFAASPPTLSKGLVECALEWPGDVSRQVNVLSLHLDYKRKAARQSQAREIIERCSGAARPLIVMGDFNCDFSGEETALRDLAEALHLAPCGPVDGPATFPETGQRLDWILISPQLECVRYEVLDAKVSDHRAVVAELRWRP